MEGVIIKSTFPLELLTEIFLRLPAKTLLRFKLVCKLWYHLITDLHFVNLHLQRSLATKTNLHFVVNTRILHLTDFETFENILELKYPFENPNHDGFTVIGTVNGLLCLLVSKNNPLLIYNPTTQTTRLLPLLPVEEQLTYREVFNFGFGFDTVSQDYKCVRIGQTYPFDRNPFSRVMIYSFNNHSWSRGPHFPYFIHNEYYFVPALLHETIHWVSDYDCDYDCVPQPIVAFSLQDENFSSLTLPEFDVEYYTCKNVTVLDGRLCLLVNYIDCCDVWIMEEYGVPRSWKKTFNVVKHEYRVFFLKIVSYSSSGKGLFVIRGPPRKVAYAEFFGMIETTNVKVSYLDLETMETTDVKVADFVKCKDAHLCVENLLMLDHANYVNVEEKEGRGEG